MLMVFTDEEEKYLDLHSLVCIRAETPFHILESLERKDKEYFDFQGIHLIKFV